MRTQFEKAKHLQWHVLKKLSFLYTKNVRVGLNFFPNLAILTSYYNYLENICYPDGFIYFELIFFWST